MTEVSKKQVLNSLFERIYRMTEEVLEELENTSCSKLELGVAEFLENVKKECGWDEPEEEGKAYFEAGYNDSTRVFYPFDGDLLDKVVVESYKKKWLKYLKCVSTYSGCCGEAAVLYGELEKIQV